MRSVVGFALSGECFEVGFDEKDGMESLLLKSRSLNPSFET